MPTNTLTDAGCKAIKPGPKASKHFDGGGLYLWVSPSGAKVWRLAYRLAGKPQTMSLGPYPLIGLAAARAKRDEVRRALLEGQDPMQERRKAPPAELTLRQACLDYWDGRKDASEGYLLNVRRALERHVYPHVGELPLSRVDRDAVLDVLLRMDRAGLHVYVRKVRLWVSLALDRQVELGKMPLNPCALIKPDKVLGRAKVRHFAALELHEVPALLQRLALEGPLPSAQACRLLALTWVRTGELRAMRWDEVDGDLWRIPAARMKMDRDHLVPLSRQALAVLAELRAVHRGGPYVFPGDRTTARPMSENAVLYLLHRIGYKGRMTGHGWRTVASTWANEAGYRPDAIERQLAHAPDDDVRAAYNRAEYLPERREMLQAWGDWVEGAWVGAEY